MIQPYRDPVPVRRLAACLAATLAGTGVAHAVPSPVSETSEVGWLDIEDLGQVKVVSASRRPETLEDTAAAVAVIGEDELRRSGATSIPEALRLVPGTEVARINSSRYGVTIRGFNGEFANKLLVLMDGRSVYTPQFTGVFWDMQDVLLEDVDRIEVVRGPGGTPWGANAFNGVVNVVSKSARETQGVLASAAGGSFDLGMVSARVGEQVGEHTWLRVFAKGTVTGETLAANGRGLDDDWSAFLGGFRLDSEPTAQDALTLQGGANYDETLQYVQGRQDRVPATGGHLLGRWQHDFSEDSHLEVQAYYDAVRRDMVQNAVNTDTADLDARHGVALGERHRVHWGIGYRFVESRPTNTAEHFFDPEVQDLQQVAIFAEDRFALVPDRLSLTAGCRGEYYTLSGWAPLPSVRLAWNVAPQHLVWSSLTWGVGAPSTADYYLNIDTPRLRSEPDPGLVNEKVTTVQLGYRGSFADRFSWDVVGYVNEYSDLYATELVPARSVLTVRPTNNMEGTAWGVEAGLTWQAASWWRWRVSGSTLDLDLTMASGSSDLGLPTSIEGRSPRGQAVVGWGFQPHDSVDIDLLWRWVDELPAANIDAYSDLDVRVAYRPRPNLEIAVVGQALTDPQHPEFSRSPGFPTRSEVPRSVYGRVTWRF